MAHNLLGASLHAQPGLLLALELDRRRGPPRPTWFEVDPDLRACLSLWSGTLRAARTTSGIKPHGAFLYACTVINRFGSAGRGLMDVVCHAASPFAGLLAVPLVQAVRRERSRSWHSRPRRVVRSSRCRRMCCGWSRGSTSTTAGWPRSARGRAAGLPISGAGRVRGRVRARVPQLVPVAPHPRPRDGRTPTPGSPSSGRRSRTRASTDGAVQDTDRAMGGLRPAPVPVHLGRARTRRPGSRRHRRLVPAAAGPHRRRRLLRHRTPTSCRSSTGCEFPVLDHGVPASGHPPGKRPSGPSTRPSWAGTTSRRGTSPPT